ncbi:MAG: AAA family ATPase [Solirubrobacteraceae bacterium MAG38_C4-C5]|nr:AAA family ATPase [Candidatus Siliceabacter maunaloa]
MSRRLLLAVPDPELARQLRALVGEGSGDQVLGNAASSEEVIATLARSEVDVVLLHEELGPLPALELARQLGSSNPTVAFLLLSRDVTRDLLHRALRAGVRDVLASPPTLEAFGEAVSSATGWAQAVRARVDDEGLDQVARQIGGRIITVAGAKGGVGTTTIALQMALAAARADPERAVCLVELDLQAGDLRTMLNLKPRRSIADLIAVVTEITMRSLDETLYVHESGLRVLLCPEHGEEAEDVGAEPMRHIMGALKFQYDVVICDVGAVLTDAGAVAVEFADRALIVTTPDVPALRAVNRTTALWDRLQARHDGIAVVLNRMHKDSEIQPDLAAKVLSAPLAQTRVPSGYRELEPAANTGEPERLEGPVAEALGALAEEVGAVPPVEARRRLRLKRGGRNGSLADDRTRHPSAVEAGQASVEMAGIAAVLALMALGLLQMVLVGYTQNLAGHAAREAARSLAVGEPVQATADEEVPDRWRQGMGVAAGADWVEVSLAVPLVVPGVELGGPLEVTERRVTVVEGESLSRRTGEGL